MGHGHGGGSRAATRHVLTARARSREDRQMTDMCVRCCLCYSCRACDCTAQRLRMRKLCAAGVVCCIVHAIMHVLLACAQQPSVVSLLCCCSLSLIMLSRSVSRTLHRITSPHTRTITPTCTYIGGKHTCMQRWNICMAHGTWHVHVHA